MVPVHEQSLRHDLGFGELADNDLGAGHGIRSTGILLGAQAGHCACDDAGEICRHRRKGAGGQFSRDRSRAHRLERLLPLWAGNLYLRFATARDRGGRRDGTSQDPAGDQSLPREGMGRGQRSVVFTLCRPAPRRPPAVPHAEHGSDRDKTSTSSGSCFLSGEIRCGDDRIERHRAQPRPRRTPRR